MDKQALIRWVRIAWTVVCGIACLLVIYAWARSFWTCDSLSIGGGHRFTSLRGQLLIDETFSLRDRPLVKKTLDRHFSGAYTEYRIVDDVNIVQLGGKGVAVPYAPLLIIAGVLAAAPWIRDRVSLRTMLIATTLFAVVLGLVCYTVR